MAEYVGLLDAGDVETANRLRCPDVQFGAAGLDALASMAEELKGELGGSFVVTGAEVERSVGDGSWVRLSLRNAAEPVMVLSNDRDGCLAAQWIVDSSVTFNEFTSMGDETNDTALSTNELMDIPPALNATASEIVTPSLERTPLQGDPSVLDGRFREWTTATGQKIGVTALEFDTADAAASGQAVMEIGFARNIVRVLDVAGPTSRGGRHLAYPITFVQPSGIGPLRDSATMRFGDRLLILTAPVTRAESTTPSALVLASALINDAASP